MRFAPITAKSVTALGTVCSKTDLLHDEKVELEVEFEDKIAHLKKMYDDALHAEDQKNQNLVRPN